MEGVILEHVIALVHQEKDAYGISFPDFPGVASGGRSLDEAIRRGAETLAFHVAGMVADNDPLPIPRSLDDLRKDKIFRADAKGAIVVAVPVELPGKAVRVNISLDERLLNAIDRAANARGENRSAFLANAAMERIRSA
jgi:predicted RNase H-like HicB family nuclease